MKEKVSKPLVLILFVVLVYLCVINNYSFAYKIEDNYITHVKANTTVGEFLSTTEDELRNSIFYKNGVEVKESEIISTGMELKNKNTNYILVVTSDLSGDGKITTRDLSIIKEYSTGQYSLTGSYLKAADLNDDGKVTALDRSLLKMLLVGLPIPGEDVANATISIIPSTLEVTQELQITLQTKGDTQKLVKQISLDGGKSYQEYIHPITLTENGIIIARLIGGDGKVVYTSTLTVSNIDHTKPDMFTPLIEDVTTNGITVTGHTIDKGNDGTAKEYIGVEEYQYSKDGGKTWEPAVGTSETSYTFSDLTQGTSYSIQMKAMDKAGNETKTEVIEQITKTIDSYGQITIQTNAEEWTNQPVEVTILWPDNIDGLAKKYSLDGITYLSYRNPLKITKNDTTIYAKLEDSTGQFNQTIPTKVINYIDILAPKSFIANIEKVTTSTIQISANTEDRAANSNSGKSDIKEYEYYIKENNSSNYIKAISTTDTSYTFEHLKESTYYSIYVVAIDNAGNKTQSNTISQQTGTTPTPPTGIVTFEYNSSEQWINKDVAVKMIAEKGVDIEYRINHATTWQRGNSYIATENCTIDARAIYNGQQIGQVVSLTITNIDKTSPVNVGLNVSDLYTNKFTLAAAGEDKESGIKSYNFYINDKLYKTVITDEAKAECLYSKATAETLYQCYVTVIDQAGNITKQELAIETPSAVAKVNAPVLASGMTPIKWDGNNEISVSADDPTWYSYQNISGLASNSSRWANAKTADGSYWVWIPRYAYKINCDYHLASRVGGEIDIVFLEGTTNTSTDGKITVAEKQTLNITTENNYVVHPAFRDDTSIGGWDKELAGIWVAKFEASGSDKKIAVKPGVTSYTGLYSGEMFTYCYHYNRNLDSHLMKNTEWGAVAYLAQSAYGVNGAKITINSNPNYYTGGGHGEAYKTNLSQSTTGNIYGIYDMSGGTYEYVAAYISYYQSDLYRYFEEIVRAPEKYKQVYTNYSSFYYGDAVYETSNREVGKTSWQKQYAHFPIYEYPVFLRGGINTYGDNAGIFNYAYTHGAMGDFYGFRPVLAI